MIDPDFVMGIYVGLFVGLVVVSILIYMKIKIPMLSSFSILNNLDMDNENEHIRMIHSKNNNGYQWEYVDK